MAFLERFEDRYYRYGTLAGVPFPVLRDSLYAARYPLRPGAILHSVRNGARSDSSFGVTGYLSVDGNAIPEFAEARASVLARWERDGASLMASRKVCMIDLIDKTDFRSTPPS
jgi:hypothetical protein